MCNGNRHIRFPFKHCWLLVEYVLVWKEKIAISVSFLQSLSPMGSWQWPLIPLGLHTGPSHFPGWSFSLIRLSMFEYAWVSSSVPSYSFLLCYSDLTVCARYSPLHLCLCDRLGPLQLCWHSYEAGLEVCILFCSVSCRKLSFGFYFLKYLGILQFTLEPEHLCLNMTV